MASGFISVLVGLHFRSLACAWWSFFTGVFIDVDHIFDYACNFGRIDGIKKVYSACDESSLDRFYLILHSYELIVVLWLVIWLFSLSALWQAAAIGATQHLIFDQLTNPLRGGAYFITYRMAVGFRRQRILKSKKE